MMLLRSLLMEYLDIIRFVPPHRRYPYPRLEVSLDPSASCISSSERVLYLSDPAVERRIE